MNDLGSEIQAETLGNSIVESFIKLLVFADDMAVFSESRVGLQKGLDYLLEYCKKWGLKVNTSKTKIMVFRKGGRTGSSDAWKYDNKPIEVVSVFKYLGFHLSSSGSFSNGIKRTCQFSQKSSVRLQKTFCFE